MNTVYFQPENINPKYCEIGMLSDTDPDYIWYLTEPCKILKSEVKIISEEKVKFNRKENLYYVSTT